MLKLTEKTVLVKTDPDEVVLESKIKLPDACRNLSYAGEVVEVSDKVTIDVSKGDRVIFDSTEGSGFVGQKIVIDGDPNYRIISQDDLLAVVDS